MFSAGSWNGSFSLVGETGTSFVCSGSPRLASPSGVSFVVLGKDESVLSEMRFKIHSVIYSELMQLNFPFY